MAWNWVYPTGVVIWYIKIVGSQRLQIPSRINPIKLMMILFQQDGALYIYFGQALVLSSHPNSRPSFIEFVRTWDFQPLGAISSLLASLVWESRIHFIWSKSFSSKFFSSNKKYASFHPSFLPVFPKSWNVFWKILIFKSSNDFHPTNYIVTPKTILNFKKSHRFNTQRCYIFM